MRFPPLHEARFVRRLNRFAATVSLNGREVMVHVANSGRMRELLQPGNLCYLTGQPGSHRKTTLSTSPSSPSTASTLRLYASLRRPTPRAASCPSDARTLVSADARLPNALVWEAWRDGALPRFEDYPSARREVRYHDSRLDLLLSSPDEQCYVEIKSVTLVQDGVARFPDAPTDRGRRHVSTLVRAVRGRPPRRGRFRHTTRRRLAPSPPTTPMTRSSARRCARPLPRASRPTPSPAPSPGSP